MGKLFFIILILCYISITISYKFNDRMINNTDVDEFETILNDHKDVLLPYSRIDHCIPVQAVKELGCTLSARNNIFKGLFQSVCEQHEICYACGFAHRITAKKCNKLALMNMYEICSQNEKLSFCDCLRQSFLAIKLLRQHVYQSVSDSPGFLFECQQKCVFDYLLAK